MKNLWQTSKVKMGQESITLCEKCPNTEYFLVRIQSKCGKIRTRKHSVFGDFSCSVKSMKSRTQKGGYCKCVHIRTGGRRIEKSVIRYVSTKWMAPNKCCGIFFVQWSGQMHQSITASKGNFAVSSIIITIILFYAKIRIS